MRPTDVSSVRGAGEFRRDLVRERTRAGPEERGRRGGGRR